MKKLLPLLLMLSLCACAAIKDDGTVNPTYKNANDEAPTTGSRLPSKKSSG